MAASDAAYNRSDAPPARAPRPFPLHRHSLPQLAVDGGAGRARLLPRVPPPVRRRHPAALRGPASRPRSCRPSSSARSSSFALSGSTSSWWRYSASATTRRSLQAVVVAALLLAAFVAIIQPVAEPSGRGEIARQRADRRRSPLYFLLTAGARRAARASSRAPSTSARCAASAPASDARGVLIVGAGDGGRLVLREILRNPDLGYPPVGFVDDDPRQAAHAHRRRARCSARPHELAAHPRRGRARRGASIAIPSAPGTLRARVVARLPRARDPGAHAADGVRAAADRRAARPPGARGPRRGRPRARAGADGARPRRART